MGHAHGRVGGVDVLAALAAGAVGVDAQVFELDVDLDGVVDFGRDKDRGEGGVTTLGGVKGRDAHQTMDAALAGQLAKGVLAQDGEGGGLDAGLFAVLVVVDFGLEALLLGPAQIHAHEHLSPVLAFSAAGAGMHGDDSVEGIGLPREHGLGFKLLGECRQIPDRRLQLGQQLLALAPQLEVDLDIAGAAYELLVVGDQRLQTLAIAHEGLGGLGIVPEGRIGKFGFEFGEFAANACGVKDTPAGRALDRAPERRRIRDR